MTRRPKAAAKPPPFPVCSSKVGLTRTDSDFWPQATSRLPGGAHGDAPHRRKARSGRFLFRDRR